jgi:hypothetical protein
LERISAIFIVSPCAEAGDQLGLDRQLGGGEQERFLRDLAADAVDLEQDAARLDAAHPELGRALAGAHAHIGGLLRHRHVREHADPHAADTLEVTGDRAAGRFDLTRGHAARLDSLEAVFAEIKREAALGVAVDTALVRLAILRAGWFASLSWFPGRQASISEPAPVQPRACPGPSGRGAMISPLEHPHLDAAGAVGGLGRRLAEIDVGAQRVQRHAALAIPLDARDLGAAEPAAAS